MSKRELAMLSGLTEVEGSRSKRRRDAVASSSDVDVSMADPQEATSSGGMRSEDADADEVKEQGLKLLQSVKDAVNKEGRPLSLDFLRQPSKRLYPDYYKIINQPIALDDIKKQLENKRYPSLEDVRKDLELCFSNAKQYNMKDSNIWQDAKDLLRVVRKTYSRMVPSAENDEREDGKKSKSKAPNLHRLIKTRLQKLVDKTDADGRILCTEFMELPPKKIWSVYYKEIKKPQCIENIFKRIKRKEYETSEDFAADVELVFANALAFNQDHSPIWEDALTLRDTFRQLISDLPSPFNLPEYSKSSNKIKIKPQATQTTSPPVPLMTKNEPYLPTSVLLRVPASSAHPAAAQNTVPPSTSTVESPKKSPSIPQVSLPIPSAPHASPASRPPAQPKLQTATPQHSVSSPTGALASATSSHYPNAAYTPPLSSVVTSSLGLPTPVPAPNDVRGTPQLKTLSVSRSSLPPSMMYRNQLKRLVMEVQPQGRLLVLDRSDGVKNWAMRLTRGETGVVIRELAFIDDKEEEEESGEEEEGEEEEEEEVLVRKGSGKGKLGGSPAKGKAAATKARMQSLKKHGKKTAEVQVKLNDTMVKKSRDAECEWQIALPEGLNILEVGEMNETVWKVFIDRINAG